MWLIKQQNPPADMWMYFLSTTKPRETRLAARTQTWRQRHQRRQKQSNSDSNNINRDCSKGPRRTKRQTQHHQIFAQCQPMQSRASQARQHDKIINDRTNMQQHTGVTFQDLGFGRRKHSVWTIFMDLAGLPAEVGDFHTIYFCTYRIWFSFATPNLPPPKTPQTFSTNSRFSGC